MNKTPVIFGVSAGAVTSGLIVAAKLYDWPYPDILIPAMPALVGIAVSFLHFLGDYIQLDTVAQRRLKKRIKTLEDSLNSPHTSPTAKAAFQKQFDQAYAALINLSTVSLRESKP